MLLYGCQVLDLTGEHALSCGQLLGDLGATVVHVEPPGGSPARADDVSWRVHTRNQHSVTVDLATAAGRDRFGELVAVSDILVDADDGGLDLAAAGFDADALERLNPSLVSVAITPFGTFGPKRDYAATDLIVQAAAGNIAVTGFADRAPLRDAGITAWSHAGVAAAGAALIGLRTARRTGHPSRIDVSAQEATSLTASFSLLTQVIGGRRAKRSDPAAGVFGMVACADGFVQNAVGFLGPTARFTQRQAAWMAAEGALDAATADAIASGKVTAETMVALAAAIRELFATRTKAELLDAACANGFVLAPVNSTVDVLGAAQFDARGAWWRDGDVQMPGPFARITPNEIALRSTAPALDAHDPDVFAPRSRAAAAGATPGRPLDGVKVLDFGWVLAGPYTSRTLADYGATVVKVESVKRVDLLRLLGPQYDFGASPDNSASFGSSTAGKRSLAIELDHPDAREVVLDMVRWADVVCESFAAGAMARMGLDEATLRAVNPDVVMVSSSLFGQTGPYASMPGYGTQGAAAAGLVLPTGYPDRVPCGPYGPFTDYVAPRYQLLAVLAAILHHERTGEGCTIDLSQAETGLHALADALARASLDGTVLDREANTDPAMRPHGIYPATGVDEWVAVAVRDDADWQALCRVIGRDDLAGSPPPDDVDEILAAWTAPRPSIESEQLLQAAGVPAHHVVNSGTAPSDPHYVARGMFVGTTYGDRDVLVTSTGYHIAGTPAEVSPIPRLGEHSAAVLRELLGYPDDRIDGLAAAGVITIAS